MFHIRIFLQTLRRNVTYTAINIAGLSIGITASVLIFLWIHHERTFDACYPDTERIYRMIRISKYGENTSIGAHISYPFIQACEDGIPEIENTAFLFFSQPIESVIVNNTVFPVKNLERGVYVNKGWLEMFHSQLLDGSFEAFGAHPFSVALSESEAKKYFGDERAVGQIIRFNYADYTVQAVVKDNPSNSSFRYHVMASTDAAMSDPRQQQNLVQWGYVNFKAFVKLRPDADVSQVTQKMNDFYAKNYNNPTYSAEASIESLTDMYFSDIVDDAGSIHGDARMVSIFALIGILLLCTACINYINLTTAKTTQRAKEVGIKKIVGAKSWTLFLQFVAESFILSLAATFIAVYLIVLLTPLYQKLVGDIPVSFSSPALWIITAITLVFVTILNGIYPALMLSSFQPVNILKGKSLPKIKDNSLRRILVVFQFTLSATLIISVIVIFMQTRYIQNTDPGFRRDHIVRVQFPLGTIIKSFESSGLETVALNFQTIKGKLQSYPDVVNVSLHSEYLENIGSTAGWRSFDWDGRTGESYPTMHRLQVDEDFMDVFELQLADGRWFSGVADMQNVILNETAIREYNIREPYIGQRFDAMGMKGSIIGIVTDFHFKSRHEKITPLIIHQSPLMIFLAIKIQEGKSAEVVREMEAIWNEFFPNDPFDYAYIDDAFNNLYQSDIRTSRILLTFSILAIVIAVMGLFGLSTFATERRTKEIGIRKVLGATVSGIVYLLTREFLLLVGIAFVIAAPLSWWTMSRWLENFAYRINITVWIFVGGAVATLVFTIIAVGVQALKAATANPVKSLKTE